jgi:hypothetical protein
MKLDLALVFQRRIATSTSQRGGGGELSATVSSNIFGSNFVNTDINANN